MNHKQRYLLFSAPLVFLATLGVFPFLGILFEKTAATLLALSFYWLFACLLLPFWFLRKQFRLSELYILPVNYVGSPVLLNLICTFLPVLANVRILLAEKLLPSLPYSTIGIAFVIALCNGCFEELYWRGLFMKHFPDKVLWAYLYPTIFFGLNHIGFGWLKGIEYPGGFWVMLGGSTVLGFLWGWVSWKSKSILFTTIAHVLTNFFGFMVVIHNSWLS